MFCILLAALALAAVATAQKTYAGVTVNQLSSTSPECTKIYTVTLQDKYTVQGNDMGMLPPMGKDTTAFGGSNYIGYPFPTDAVKQAAAASQNSVTALTEATGGQTELKDAYPLGFQTDTLFPEYSVCVYVRNVYNRWVEIMAEAPDRTLCVTDWQKATSAANPAQKTCGHNRLYTCRESGNAIRGNSFDDTMAVRFYCEGPSCESSDFKFRWRIVASHIQAASVQSNNMPDQEYFCHMRLGTDYPLSLLQPYPAEYRMPAVFEKAAASAGSHSASLSLALLALLSLLLVAVLFI